MISEEMGLTQLQTKDIVQRTLDEITHARWLPRGESNFATSASSRSSGMPLGRLATRGRGEKVDIPAKNVVTFKPGKEMEEQVRKIDLKSLPESAEAESGAEARDGEDEEANSFPRLA